jgi:hypothetical protein
MADGEDAKREANREREGGAERPFVTRVPKCTRTDSVGLELSIYTVGRKAWDEP